MALDRVKKQWVAKPKRYEIYHTEIMPDFLIADTKAEANEAKRNLEKRYGGTARIADLKGKVAGVRG